MFSRLPAWLLILSLIFSGFPARAQAPEKTFSLDRLAIPKNLGSIQERFEGGSEGWIVLIQDVHGHFAAQENIAALVDHLNAVYGLRAAALEGGWGVTSFPKSWALPSSREKQMLARALLEEEYITGPAYAALFVQTPLLLAGMEDPSLYEQNRALYLENLSLRDSINQGFEKIGAGLEKAKQETYGPELLAFDRALQDFKGFQDAGKFLPQLFQEASARQVNLDDLEQVSLVRQILEMEKAIDKDRLNKEAARLMEAFKQSRLSLEELLKSGLVPEDRLQHYPESQNYLALLRLQDRISHRLFFEEIDTAVKRVKDTLFQMPEERDLDARWEVFMAVRQILLLEATPEILAEYRGTEEQARTLLEPAGLEKALEKALRFYDLAFRRDEVFASRIINNPKLPRDLILVAGGFHTDGLTAKLREARLSHFVISPDLGGTPPDPGTYHARLKDSVVHAQTLSAVQNRFFTRRFDDAFAAGVDALKLSRNVLEARNDVVRQMQQSPDQEETPAVSGSISWEEFQAWSRDRKRSWLKELLKSLSGGQERTYLLVEASVLTELLQDETAQRLFNWIREGRENTVVLTYTDFSEIPAEALGGKYRLERFEAAGISGLLSESRFQNRFREALEKKAVAAITSGNLQDKRILALEKHPVSFLYRLFLSRPELQQFIAQAGFLEELEGLLLEIENLDAVLESA